MMKLHKRGIRKILRRIDPRCYLCIIKEGITLDHVWPRSRNGQSANNVLLACAKCNMRKADRKPYACEILYCQITYEIAKTDPAYTHLMHRVERAKERLTKHLLTTI